MPAAYCGNKSTSSNSDELTIRMLDGKQLRLGDVSYSKTVDSLKRRIATELGPKCYNSRWAENSGSWAIERQKLWAYGCYLENDRTLSDYHLNSGNRIYLTLRID